ncbi:hypothetical protein AOL_s00004g17 [Orbilia oligospora ATCC 24927]|uniref:Uncharacterized protein n=1 Tax=Arthrobotrys oligospora (strain ATCC 24927 / CBS 115.81 / DSM 1491) TaxID=756982 RepID=G1WXK7_ARTOA|nr:hypothetical protein AOL_s00004g17 [Orbilia oligospora ATCC 24927]EGX54368.1 hypothetical protein AOL_s00004g17 [Orbilia oligospora ATCC 24927]
MDANGGQETNPIKLTDDIVCHSPDEPFGKCECKGEGKSERHSHFAHTLLPSKLFRTQLTTNPVQLCHGGALIFGNDEKSKQYLGDLGHPEVNAPLTSPESETLSNDVDSGLGTSLSQSSFFDPRTKLGTDPSFTNSKSRSGRRLTSAQTSDGIGIAQASLVFRREEYNVGIVCALPKEHLALESGGGVPSEKNDIQLGDVVVSHPEGDSTGVIQYDFGKTLKNNEFVRKGFLQSPPRFIITGISDLESDPNKARYPLQACLESIATRHPEYGYPGYQFDPLLAANAERNRSSSGDGHKEEEIPRNNAQVSKL